MRFFTNILFVQHIMMSHRSDSSPKEMVDNTSFVLQVMQQQFEKLNLVLGEVRDRMDHQDVVIRNLHGRRDRRRPEFSVENGYENEEYGDSLVTRHALNTKIKMDDIEQKSENIFHTRCHINNKVCSMIIDLRSCINLASTTLVEKLNLRTLKHPRPYMLQWLSDCGEVRVNKQVLVSFSIGKYQDMVLCDVVPMHASHILLGKPWQYDRKVIHDGLRNMYSFEKDGKTIKLAPLTPKQVHGDQLKLKCKVAQNRKSKSESD